MALFQIMKKHGFDRLGDGPGSSDYQGKKKGKEKENMQPCLHVISFCLHTT